MSPGAKKQFDRDEVLDRAMQLFWEKGYEGTGMAELLERMEIGRQSLYDTFGNKRDLFLEVMEHYAKTRIREVRGILEGARSPLAGIRTLLKRYEEHSTCEGSLGCLFVNTMAESAAPIEGFDCVLQDKLKGLEQMYRGVFEAAKEAGELRPDADTLGLARVMCSLMISVMLMGRIGVAKPMIRDAIRMNRSLIEAAAV